jgi:hypothetical protein
MVYAVSCQSEKHGDDSLQVDVHLIELHAFDEVGEGCSRMGGYSRDSLYFQ